MKLICIPAFSNPLKNETIKVKLMLKIYIILLCFIYFFINDKIINTTVTGYIIISIGNEIEINVLSPTFATIKLNIHTQAAIFLYEYLGNIVWK